MGGGNGRRKWRRTSASLQKSFTHRRAPAAAHASCAARTSLATSSNESPFSRICTSRAPAATASATSWLELSTGSSPRAASASQGAKAGRSAPCCADLCKNTGGVRVDVYKCISIYIGLCRGAALSSQGAKAGRWAPWCADLGEGG